MVQVWISDTAGAAVSGTAPSGTVVIGTNGTLVSTRVTKVDLLIRSTTGGQFDLNITEVGVKSYYLNVSCQGQYFSQVATWA